MVIPVSQYVRCALGTLNSDAVHQVNRDEANQTDLQLTSVRRSVQLDKHMLKICEDHTTRLRSKSSSSLVNVRAKPARFPHFGRNALRDDLAVAPRWTENASEREAAEWGHSQSESHPHSSVHRRSWAGVNTSAGAW